MLCDCQRSPEHTHTFIPFAPLELETPTLGKSKREFEDNSLVHRSFNMLTLSKNKTPKQPDIK